jgi:ribokinase
MGGGIIVVGSINLDMVAVSPVIPGPGDSVCCGDFHMVPGGKGANQAVAAQKLGNHAILLGRVGTDHFGDVLVGYLESCGVGTSLIKRTESEKTGVALIVIEKETGDNMIVVAPGANSDLSVADLDSLDPYYGQVHSILFQFEIPVGVISEGAKRARERGVVTILDAGPPRGVDITYLRDFDVVSPNQSELAALTGQPVSDVETALRSAEIIVDDGIPTVAVKMGEMGSLLVTREGAWHFPAYEVKAVDATAAGDAFTAALATALGEGMELPRAMLFANAAGAVAVSAFGAQPSMPTRAQVEGLMGLEKSEEGSWKRID